MGEDRWAGLGTVVVMILAVTVAAGLLAITRAESDDDVAMEDTVVDEPEPVEEDDEDVVVADSPDELWTAHEDATVRNVVSDGEAVCAAAELELFCVDAA